MSPRISASLMLAALLSVCGPGVVAAAEKKNDDDAKAQDRFRTSALRPSDGYLVDWDVLGPLPAREEDGFGIASMDVENITDLDPSEYDGARYVWTFVAAKNGAGLIDLSERYSADTDRIAYAVAEVYVNRDMDASIILATRDEAACWINGQKVEMKPKRRHRGYSSPVRLRMGHNEVVIGLHHVRGKWEFSARMLDQFGDPIDPKRLHILDDSSFIDPPKGRGPFEPQIHRP